MNKEAIREYFSLASSRTIDFALKIDAKKLSNTPDDYIRDNHFTYEVAINTWAYIIKEVSRYCWISLLDHVEQQGLYYNVIEFGDAAQVVLDSIEAGQPVSAAVLGRYPVQRAIFLDIAGYFGCDPEDMSTSGITYFLNVCRYLKRMTPLHADVLEEKAIRSFIDCQNRQKLRDRRDPNPIFVEMVKDELPKGLIRRRTMKFNKITVADIELTPGVGFNSKAKLVSKLEAINKDCPQFFDNEKSSLSYTSVIEYQHLKYGPNHLTRLESVPKSFKIGRTIAMEDTFRQGVSRRMFTITDELLPPAIDLHDQSKNQSLARIGSKTGEWATIDLSHASDDVTKTLVALLYPYDYYKHLERIAPTHTVLPNGKVIPLYSWATMGNSMTFVMECEVFYAICRAAIKFHARHFGDVPLELSVYGDDIIVPAAAYETVCGFLEYFGFVVNKTKSYCYGKFRESCGADCYDGVEISSRYYPRFPVTEFNYIAHDGYKDEYSTSISRLVTLQHRLSEVSLDASQYLAQVIRSMVPKINTTTARYSTSSELYGIEESYARMRTLPRYVMAHLTLDYGYRIDRLSMPTIVHNGEVRSAVYPEDWEVPENRFYKWHELPSIEHCADTPLVEKYLYLKFLKEGPRYASELDRLLNVSEPFRVPAQGQPNYNWGYDMV